MVQHWPFDFYFQVLFQVWFNLLEIIFNYRAYDDKDNVSLNNHFILQ